MSKHGTAKWLLLAQPDPANKSDQRSVRHEAAPLPADVGNPIPVNGPIGEVIYLSNLRTAGGQPIMFHRLGSVRKINVYETVTFDGGTWDILFLDFYHPRKSKLAPTGCRIAASAERQRLFFGTNEFVADFPNALPGAIARARERLLGIFPIQPAPVLEALERRSFERRANHRGKLKAVMITLDVNQRDDTVTLAQSPPTMVEPPPDPQSGPAKSHRNSVEAGRMLAKILMDPDDCWRHVCMLRQYKAPDSGGCAAPRGGESVAISLSSARIAS